MHDSPNLDVKLRDSGQADECLRDTIKRQNFVYCPECNRLTRHSKDYRGIFILSNR